MDSSRRLVILLVAGVIVAFAAIYIRSKLSDSVPPPPELQAIAAQGELSLGTLVQSGDLAWVPVENGTDTEGMLLNNAVALEDFTGAVVRKQLKPGEFLKAEDLMKAGEGGFMSAVLEPGMRAVSVAVNATSGNAGFISPGDRVDLIITHRIQIQNGGERGGQESVVSETFVRNVRVLAVDQMLDNPENKAILAKTVTVEVNDAQAEQIAVATEMGKISMALRSLAGAPKEGSKGATEKDISPIMGTGAMPRVRVIRGDEIENMEFSQ
ncbi:MAG: Flp pilus assembly protein CpaB [Rickettsiales bacterium]